MTPWTLALVVGGVAAFGVAGFYFAESMRFRIRCYRVRQEIRAMNAEIAADYGES